MMRIDDPLSRRIVSAFIDFLGSVEHEADDGEALEVAKDCLRQVFRLDQTSGGGDLPEPNFLVKAVTERGLETQNEASRGRNEDVDTLSPKNSVDAENLEASNIQDNGGFREACDTGLSSDEIVSQFIAALEKIRLSSVAPGGNDDHVLLDKAICLLQDAINEIESSGCKTFNYHSLAEALKTLGNKAMQSKLYFAAIERYTCAISLWENNAVFYCNRAAAYTQLLEFTSAVSDCHKAIEIDPNYSKAYSRLGLAYYAQGNYADAINKGFKKALELDPRNDGIKENLEMAERKLKEQQERPQNRHSSGGNNWGSWNHNTSGSTSQAASASYSFDAGSLPANFASMFSNMGPNLHQGQNSQHREGQSNQGNGTPPTFTPIPFGVGSLPADLASRFVNLAQGENFHDHPHQGSSMNGFDDPVSIGGDINVNIAEQLPEELMGTLRSMMGMFQGAQERDTQGNHDRRSESS